MRIDNFIIKLIRKHEYILNTLATGFIPPEAFFYLHSHGFIQNRNGIPILYHIYRRATDKRIVSKELTKNSSRFDTSASTLDFEIFIISHTKMFWWLKH